MSIVPTGNNRGKYDSFSPDRFREDKNKGKQDQSAVIQKGIAAAEFTAGVAISPQARAGFNSRMLDTEHSIAEDPLTEGIYLWGYLKDGFKGPGTQPYWGEKKMAVPTDQQTEQPKISTVR